MTESRFNLLVALTVAGALTASAALLAWTFWPVAPVSAPQASPAASPAATKSTASPRTDLIRQLKARDLFGLASPGQPAGPAPPEASTLKYDLLGTVVHSDAWRSIAILRDKSTKLQKVYTEGRRMDDALVKKIGKNYVIFERQGREEILKMKP